MGIVGKVGFAVSLVPYLAFATMLIVRPG